MHYGFEPKSVAFCLYMGRDEQMKKTDNSHDYMVATFPLSGRYYTFAWCDVLH